MIIGRFTKGETPVELVADTKFVLNVLLFDDGGILPKLTVLLDGGGSGVGDLQVARPVVYLGDELLAVGDEFAVEKGSPQRWVDMEFAGGGPFLPHAALYSIGLHAGGFTNIIRLFA